MGTTVRPGRIAVHIALILYTILALGPILLILVNAFKTRRAIFADPLGLPNGQTFTTIGFDRVFANADFGLYFFNSLTVTLVSLVLIVLIGAMAAWALTEYRFPGNTLLSLYLAIGIMVPIRLGSVSILRMMVELNLVNTLTALILVYVAQGLPLAILILGEFIQQIPKDLRDAARCDGVSEYRIFFSIILPLISPAIATVAVFTMVPVWNDLWFPLILAPGDGKQTITLGVQQFIGQYVTDWNAVLASLTLAIAPVLVLYLVFSRYLVRGLTAGAVK
ncbi:carbohydrate ABC transporter permease [Microvirga lotononidis]|uniref:sn-glycerol-3-phosphate transport system permease protein UgpE n=1 Tax=Microvirga lotononidis TaxID=864069 RepID=I4YM09_9HYPH|nr:carbohydrate ABC transporter permease [Microvirga lotononidis]EIM25001.1 ABC-type sugar transport system, permease component [Microvirga lotononidis]WQO29505.1 carbohydrate ABC transporter permease [Microvirga lotononidis]